MPLQSLGRVLVVDDEVELMNVLMESLSAQGYTVTGFTSGQAGLDALQTQNFDLLLTDLMMPGMDGIALLKAGLAVDPNLVGVIMTGQGTVPTAVEAMKIGAFDYVLKPFRMDALLPVLARAMEVHRLRQENIHLRETVAIYNLSQVIAFSLDSRLIIEKTADAALQQVEADEVSLMLVTPAGDEFYVAAVRGKGREGLRGQRVSFQQGIAGWVAHQTKPLILNGEIQDLRFAPTRPRPDIHSAISMPLLAAGKLVGVLNVNSLRPRRLFTLGQVKALSILTSTAAAALHSAALYEESERLREYNTSIVETMAEGLLVEDSTGHITFANPRLQDMVGYSAEELLGQHWSVLVPPSELAYVTEQSARRTQGQVNAYESVLLSKEGREIVVLVSATPFRASQQFVGTVVTFADITKRKQAEAELAALYRATAPLLNPSQDLLHLAEGIAQTVTREFALADCGVLLVSQAGDELKRIARTGNYAVATASTLPVNGPGLTVAAFRSDEMVYAPDVTAESRYIQGDPRTRSELVVPLRAGGQVIGILDLQSPEPNAFDERARRIVAAYAERAALALQNTRLHQQTEQRLRRLSALRAIDRAISSSLDVHVTLNVVLGEVITNLDVDAADVLLFNPYTHTLDYTSGRGFRSRVAERARPRPSTGYAGRAVFERRLIALPAVADEEPDLAQAALWKEEGFQAYFGAPLMAKANVKGVLEIFHRTPLHPDPEWLDFLEALAGQAAIAIDNAELFVQLQNSNNQLIIAYDATIEGWSRALDLRDKETEGHSQRVTEMTLHLARALTMSEDELVHVRRGALLHDIGKMGIPDHILLKPGHLTDDEWRSMRQHPTYAYEMLSPIVYLRPALDIPYCHHEKWDGTGYPRGLQGEQIPLAARLFAIVDVWDALRSDRPYRPGWPEAKVLEYIRSQSGAHFDPAVVEVFLRLVRVEHTPIR